MADIGGKFRRDPQPPCDSIAEDDGECPCEGAYNTGIPDKSPKSSHYFWLAFLRRKNGDFREEEWLRDYKILPTNWITCKLSGSDIFHCQIFFWNQLQQTHVTFSVDANQKTVHYSTQKEFSYGWSFLRVACTKEQERIMYDFLAEQALAEKPFNWLGALLLFFMPFNTGTSTWFCSQLVTAAMQQAGFLKGLRPEATYPSQLYELVKSCGEMSVLESEHPIKTKETWMRVQTQLTSPNPVPKGESLIKF